MPQTFETGKASKLCCIIKGLSSSQPSGSFLASLFAILASTFVGPIPTVTGIPVHFAPAF